MWLTYINSLLSDPLLEDSFGSIKVFFRLELSYPLKAILTKSLRKDSIIYKLPTS